MRQVMYKFQKGSGKKKSEVIFRNDVLIEGRIIVKKVRGRPQQDIKYRMKIGNYCDLQGSALDRQKWLWLPGTVFKI